MTGSLPSEVPLTGNDWRRAPAVVLALATLAGVYASYRLALPFVPALTWALTLAVLFAPVHRWNEARLKRPSLAASISVIMIVVIVVVPGIVVGGRLIGQAARGAFVIRDAIDAGEWQRAVESHPRFAPLVDWAGRQMNVSELLGTIAVWLTNMSGSLVRGSIAQATSFVLTFYFLFYFLRDRRVALASMLRVSPLSSDELHELTSRVADAIYATFYGTMVCAAVQGTLGGLMFWWLGFSAPLLWGVMMGLLAIVPVFGAFVVWIPAAAFLALDGHWGQALLMTGWGAVVIGGIDNLLYPILVGDRLRLHTVPAFVSIVGGLLAFGASGIILGPLLFTLTLTLLGLWRVRMSQRPQDSEPTSTP